MPDFGTLDPQTTAKQLAGYDVMALQAQLKKQQGSLSSQKTALTALKTALSDFRSVMTGMNKVGSGLLQNSATSNIENIVGLKANSSAAKGTYDIFVEKMASAHQLELDELTDESIKGATGTLKLTIGDKELEIEMDGLQSLSDLQKKINSKVGKDTPALTASLVRTDGNVTLMLSSNNTGEANNIKVDFDNVSGITEAQKNQKDLTKAEDAVIYLGGKSSGKRVTSASNTLDTLIEGVSIDLLKVQKNGDDPLRITVGTDSSATQEQIQKFVDAYNAIKESIGSMTAVGSKDSGRGIFAGDASMASLSRQLNNMVRTSVGGIDMTQFGITADKNGKLSIDNEKLSKALKEDPKELTALFNGDKGLLKEMDKTLDTYLNTKSGLLKGRQETLDRQEGQLTERADQINSRYESSYNRYLKQFTRLQEVMSQMNNTMSMFGLV